MWIPLLCVCVLYSYGSRGLKQWVVTSKSHMGEMRVSDWSRRNLLRSDWLLPRVAICTTNILQRKPTSWAQRDTALQKNITVTD